MKYAVAIVFLTACGSPVVAPEPPKTQIKVDMPAVKPAADPIPDAPTDPEPTMQEKLQKALDKGIAAKKALVGAAAEYRLHGETVWAGASGDADAVTHDKMTAAHSFRIASSTKMYVAAIVMQLIDEGKLTLASPLSTWRPDIDDAANITVEHLLSHRSGFNDYQENPDYQTRAAEKPHVAMTPNEVIAFALALPPKFAPGTSWAYANTNYFLLGEIIETITGAPLTAALEARIFTPLALSDTSLAGADPSTLAKGYDGTKHDVTTLYDPSFFWAAGSMVSTAHDVNVFLEALTKGKLTSAASLAEMTRTRSDLGGISDALGVFVEQTKLGDGIGHGGNYFGYLSEDYYFPASDSVLTVLFNTDSTLDGKTYERDLVKALIQIIANE